MGLDRIASPMSSTGIMRFYDTSTHGPALDPRAVLVFSVVLIILIKIAYMMVRTG